MHFLERKGNFIFYCQIIFYIAFIIFKIIQILQTVEFFSGAGMDFPSHPSPFRHPATSGGWKEGRVPAAHQALTLQLCPYVFFLPPSCAQGRAGAGPRGWRGLAGSPSSLCLHSTVRSQNWPLNPGTVTLWQRYRQPHSHSRAFDNYIK